MVVSEPKIVDFVVVLETTANMVDHWDSILKSYIRPALEYFNGKATTAMDFIGNNGNSHYGYVLFHSDDSSLEPVTTSAVIQSPSLFLRKLDLVVFGGGGSAKCCLVAEGLGRALKIFDDISNKRVQRDSTKICILVCGSPPYSTPCCDTREHYGRTYEDLAKAMGDMNVHLSVISPHHIKQMKDIYRFSNPSKSTLMNYAQDPRHLVLISGFDLPIEQTPVKFEQNEEPVATGSLTTSVSSFSVSSPSIQPTTTTSSTYNSNPTITPQPSYASPIPPPQPTIQIQSSTSQNQNSNLLSQASTIKQEQMPSVSVPQSSPHFTQEILQDTKPSLPPSHSGIPPSSFSMQGPSHRSLLNIPQKPPSGHPQPNSAQRTAESIMVDAIQQQQNVRPVWTGLLEWNEKRAAPTGVEERTLHQLNCEIVISRNSVSEDNIGANYWPEKLTMQLVPRIVLTNEAVKPFLRNIPVVFLKLSPHDQSIQLCNLMTQRWMGVINVLLSPSGIPQQGDQRVILVIHSPKNGGQMIGLVSRDSASLINAIKQALKTRHPTPATQLQQQPGRGSVFPPGGRTVNVTNPSLFRPNVPGRMSDVQMPGIRGGQARQMEFIQQQQGNNPGQPVPQPNMVVSQNQGNPQQRYQPIIRHQQPTARLPQQHPGLRLAHQQTQQPQITLNRPHHSSENVRALLTGATNSNPGQPMSQQQRPGIVNPRIGQASNLGFMQTQQMRHSLDSRVMGMSQQRFNMH